MQASPRITLRGRRYPGRRLSIAVAYVIVCWFSLLIFGAAYADGHDPVTVVVNPALAGELGPIPPSVLPSIFAMRMRTWPNQTQIHVFVLASDDPVHATFCKQTLGVFPQQMRAAWDRQIFSGTGQSPTEVASESEMRARVASTAGAIGYLRNSMLDASVKPLPLGQ